MEENDFFMNIQHNICSHKSSQVGMREFINLVIIVTIIIVIKSQDNRLVLRLNEVQCTKCRRTNYTPIFVCNINFTHNRVSICILRTFFAKWVSFRIFFYFPSSKHYGLLIYLIPNNFSHYLINLLSHSICTTIDCNLKARFKNVVFTASKLSANKHT